MKNNLFHPENWIWQPFGWVADFLILSCLWVICSMPVVTAGAASAAVYDCCARCLKDGERELFSRFFRTFRRELRLSIPTLLLWAGILGCLFFLVRSFTASAAATSANLILAYSMVFLLAAVVGVASWVFPLQSRFTFRFAGLNAAAVRLALAHLPRTIALSAVSISAGWICLRFWLPVMVVPGMAGLLSAYILEPVFKAYEAENEG